MYPLPIEDADRDRVITELQRQHAAGYLDQSELATRTETALRTDDSHQLQELLADLPGYQTWTPSPHQQLAPYEAAAQMAPNPAWQPEPEAAWKTFLRNAKPWLIGAAAALLLMWVFFAPGSGGSFWWMFWIFIIFIRPALQTKNQRHQQRTQPFPPITPPNYPPHNQPPRVADSYDADGRDGPSPGQWNQPPRN